MLVLGGAQSKRELPAPLPLGEARLDRAVLDLVLLCHAPQRFCDRLPAVVGCRPWQITWCFAVSSSCSLRKLARVPKSMDIYTFGGGKSFATVANLGLCRLRRLLLTEPWLQA